MPPGASAWAIPGARRVKGPARILAGDKVAAFSNAGERRPRRGADERQGGIDARILARHRDRDGIDVRGGDGTAPQLRRRDGEQAGAAAEIEDILEATPFRKIAKDAKTEGGGLVMAGAEGKSRLDADGDDAGRHAAPVMRAMDEEAPGAHRRQSFLAQRDPVGVGQGFDRHRPPREP